MKFNKVHTQVLAAIIAGAASFSSMAHKVDIDDIGTLEFKADAFIKGYHLDNDSNSEAVESSQKKGAQSRVRLTANMYGQDGWAIKTRWLGYYDWKGDRRQNGGSGSDFESGDNVDSVSMDVAYLEYTGSDGWLFRAGRQEANWAYGFNISDDRRDRIMLMKTINTSGGYFALLGLYDLRFSQQNADTNNVYNGDLSMYTIGGIGNHKGLDYGLLWAYFDGEGYGDGKGPNPYSIKSFHNISGYFGKTFDKFSTKGAFNVIQSSADDEINKYIWGNDSWSAFVETGYQLTDSWQVQGQAAMFADGGLVGRGWDSYSMLINNSPRNEENPVMTGFFGGIGAQPAGQKDGNLFGLRANWTASEDLSFTVAAGQVDMDSNANTSTKSTFYDAKAVYQFSKSSSVELRAGHADGDLKDTAVMTTIRVNFG